LSVIVGVGYLGLLALTVWRVDTAPKGFIPTQDQGYLLLNVQLPDAASVQRTQAIMDKIQRICLGDDKLHESAGLPLPKPGEKKYPGIPGIEHMVGIAGESFLLSTTGSNLGSAFIILKPWGERPSAEYDAAIAKRIQTECAAEIEGALVGAFRAPPIRGLGNAGGFKLQTEQRGYVDLKELQQQTDQLIAKANADPRFAGVFTIFRASTPQLFVDIDRAKVESLQVPIQDVFTTLQVDMGSQYVNLFVKFGRTWQVNVQAAPRFRTEAGALMDFQVRNSQGQMAPLGTLVEIRRSTGPLFVMRYNMAASAAINGTPAPGVSSGTVVDTMTQMAKEVGVKFEWTEMSFLEVEAGNLGMLVFVFGAVLVYFVLAAKYESWRLPLAVILVVPLCMLAAEVGMTIVHLPIDIFVQIGLLVLVGLACKNAILIVEYARQLHEEGKDARDAAIGAAQIRFRPIIMTSLAFIFGVVPLVVATGAGAEMRQSLGIAVFSGMIGVTFFGIFLTPFFFYGLTWLSDRRAKSQAVPQAKV
jgi:multidrug efflux pump subunit AcrB